MKIRTLVFGALLGMVGLSGCNTTESHERSELPTAIADVVVGESSGLREMLGDDWAVAYVDYCPGDSLTVQNMVVDVNFVPCVDPDFGLANLVLIGRTGEVVRWFEQALPVAVLYGCYTPDATWTRDQNGFSSGAEGNEPCVPDREG